MNNKIGVSMHPPAVQGELDRLEAELDEIEAAGADCAELVMLGLDIVSGGKILRARMDTLLSILARHRFEYTLHLPYELNLMHETAGEVYAELFRVGIEAAREASCGILIFHAGCSTLSEKNLAEYYYPRYGRSSIPELEAKLIEAECRQLRELSDMAGDILLCLENGPIYHPGQVSCGWTGKAMADFARLVDRPNFRLTYDIGHAWMLCKRSGRDFLQDAADALPCIGHLHMHDNCGRTLDMSRETFDHRILCGVGDIHLPLGWGNIPVADLLKVLAPYSGIINLETEYRFRDSYARDIAWLREMTKG